MDRETQLKLQAALDEELTPAEAAELDQLLTSNPEARALTAELKVAREATKAFAAATTVPASRDFYWSGIKREIEKLEQQPHAAPAALKFSWLDWLTRALVPAGALALVIAAGIIAGHQSGLISPRAQRLEASLSSPGSFTYRDFNEGTTLVWLSYPAEKELDDWE